MRFLPSLLAALLVSAAPAAAAAPWSPAAPIPGAPDTSPQLALDASGPRAVYWSTISLGPVTPGVSISGMVSVLGAGLVPGPAQTLDPAGLNIGTPVAYGAGDVLLGASRPPTAAIGVASGPLAGPLSFQPLPGPVVAAAANHTGDRAVLIRSCNPVGCGSAPLKIALARPGHGFGQPIALDRSGSGNAQSLAMDRRGRVLAAWDRVGGVYARFVSINGRLGPIQRLGTQRAPTRFEVALPGDGRAAIGWTAQRTVNGEANSPFTATLALAAKGGRFAKPRLLGSVPSIGTRFVPFPGFAVRLANRRSGFATWTGYDGTNYVVRAAPITGTTIGSAQTVSAPGADTILGDAAESLRGQAAILLLPGSRVASGGVIQPDAIAAVTTSATTQPFGQPEQIAAGSIDGADLGIDAATGVAFATWRTVGAPLRWSTRAPIG